MRSLFATILTLCLPLIALGQLSEPLHNQILSHDGMVWEIEAIPNEDQPEFFQKVALVSSIDNLDVIDITEEVNLWNSADLSTDVGENKTYVAFYLIRFKLEQAGVFDQSFLSASHKILPSRKPAITGTSETVKHAVDTLRAMGILRAGDRTLLNTLIIDDRMSSGLNTMATRIRFALDNNSSALSAPVRANARSLLRIIEMQRESMSLLGMCKRVLN